MSFDKIVLREDERATYQLRKLYLQHGYSHYRVSKFEEYDLYAKNKSFLVSENLLTFTDTNGKLMALKPDVTLSIIKNVVADVKNSYKVYYDEHVYRTTNSGDGFREITQTGLESIGNIDIFAESEVIMLAMKSLLCISEDYLLDISHMRLLEGLIESLGVDYSDMSEIFALFGSKNVSGLRAYCNKYGIDSETADKLCELASMYLPIGRALDILKPYVVGEKMQAAFDELREICAAMREYGLEDKLYLDLSIVNDMNYYDGVIFKGFVNGIPDSILSGGRYDRLMERFGKKMGAVGFAVYLDKLERFGNISDSFDVDYMLVYDSDVPSAEIIEAARKLGVEGSSVRASSAADAGVRCRKLVRLSKEGIVTCEAND